MLKYPIKFVYNDSVSVILLRWNTDRGCVSLHVKIFDGFCIQGFSISRDATDRARVSLFGWFCIQKFSIYYYTKMEYKQSTCNFTC